MWKIAHFEPHADGSVSVTKLVWLEGGKVKETHQLQKAIRIPPPGPGRGPAVAAMRQTINALRNPPPPPDVSGIEDALNAGGE